MSLMEQGVHKYGMVVAYFQCRSSIYIFGVYMILIKEYDTFLYSDQQGLTKLKTNKKLFVQPCHIRNHIFGSGRNFSPLRNFQQGFLSFCKNKTPCYLNYSLDKLKRFTLIFATHISQKHILGSSIRNPQKQST